MRDRITGFLRSVVEALAGTDLTPAIHTEPLGDRMTIVGDYKPLILRHTENDRDGFVILPTSDNWERKLFFENWADLTSWVEALAGQVVTVENPAAEVESLDDWLKARG